MEKLDIPIVKELISQENRSLSQRLGIVKTRSVTMLVDHQIAHPSGDLLLRSL